MAVAIAVPLLLWKAPELIRLFFTSKNVVQRTTSTDRDRGRLAVRLRLDEEVSRFDRAPEATDLAHGVETLVLVPLVVVLGAAWGATGAAGAVLASTVVFIAFWTASLLRIRRGPASNGTPPPQPEAVLP